ncbi:glycosyltransferase family 9 protein [Halonatronum saccharophilum]|uniref:glycosyltransferase family 9 protein n=1 Tax=Halonatronum saccharophilum TaxID=150060 RepID=UPI000480A610|nr:glycosyltransferase family 9 protein [Halonatronum saccharophilum]
MDLTAKKVLLINFGEISDLVLTLPIFDILKGYSDISLTLLTLKENEEILLNHPLLDQLILFDKNGIVEERQGGKIKVLNSFKSLKKELKKGNYDLGFDLEGNFRSSLLSLLSRVKKRVGFEDRLYRLFYNYTISRKGEHKLGQYLSLLDTIGVDKNKKLEYPLPKWERAKGYVQNICNKNEFFNNSPLIALYPSGKEGGWSEDDYRQLDKWIEENLQQDALVFTNGQGIGDALISSKRNKRIHTLVRRMDLKCQIELLKQVDILITDDITAMALANISKTPTIALSNSQSQKVGPYEGNNLVLKGPDDQVSNIKVETVTDFIGNFC